MEITEEEKIGVGKRTGRDKKVRKQKKIGKRGVERNLHIHQRP